MNFSPYIFTWPPTSTTGPQQSAQQTLALPDQPAECDTAKTPILPPPLTDAEAEDRPTLAADFCDCSWRRIYYGGEHHCDRCKNSDPHTIRQHVIELLEEAGTWAANNGNLALSSELFDTASSLKGGVRL